MSINTSNDNGLRKLSIIRVGKIATIDKVLIRGIMGSLNSSEILELNTKLKIVFDLD